MKVEFKDSVLGYSLYVDISQFLLAKDSEEEFDSLYRAVYAFYQVFCFDYDISDDFDKICGKIGKRGKIIFTCKKSDEPYEKYVEIYSLSNNDMKKVISEKV